MMISVTCRCRILQRNRIHNRTKIVQSTKKTLSILIQSGTFVELDELYRSSSKKPRLSPFTELKNLLHRLRTSGIPRPVFRSPIPPRVTSFFRRCIRFYSRIKAPTLDKRVYPIAMSTFLMGAAIGLVIPVMPMFITKLGLTPTEFGFLMAIVGVTRFIFNIPLATLADVKGRRPLLILGPLTNMVAMIGTGLSTTLTELSMFRFLSGLGGGAQMTGANLYLTDISNASNRARTLAPMNAAWSAGASVGPFIGGIISDHYGFQAPFYFVGATIAVVSLSNYLLLPETLPADVFSDKPTPANATPATSPATSTSNSRTYNFYKSMRFHLKLALAHWRTLLQNPNVRSLVFLHTAYWVLTSGIQFTLLPLLVINEFQMSAGYLGFLYGIMALINLLGVGFAATLADKVGRRAAIIPGVLITAISVCFLPSFGTTVQGLICLVALWAVGGCMMAVAPNAYMVDISSGSHAMRSQGLALLRTAGDLGFLTGTASSGILASVWGIPAAVYLNVALVLIFTVHFVFKAKETLVKPTQ